MSKLEIQATISALHEALAFIRIEAGKHGLSENSTYQLEIAAEEALVNAMLHGYPEPGPQNRILIEVLSDADTCKLILTDRGVPFNPTENVPEIDEESSEREVGGLGIYFIYKYTDGVSYERLGLENQLTLSKAL
jgi:anti-sigma regulatory factor (Ser/Thr protein kinase)